MEIFSLNEVIELAVQIEKNGYQFYDAAFKRKDLSSKARELIERLRDEELQHEATFKNLRSSLDYEKLGDLIDWQQAASYLKAISDAHIFSDPAASIKLATSASDESEIIEFAFRFEKDTLIFFYSLHHTTTEISVKKIINKIIDEEVTHVMLLMDMKKEL
ncbi:MAG: ferritin family protein [Candidatus Cloacimonadales bacterium]|nr:ferritin family protein [Candidatus Cloacimonadales bacterium]